MSEQNRIGQAEQALEERLRQLQPVTSSPSADQMLFAAGQASALRSRRRWQWATSCLALLLLCSLMGQVPRTTTPEPLWVLDNDVEPSVTSALEPVETDSEDQASYLRLRHSVLEQGVDALPAERGSQGRALRAVDRELWLGDEMAI